MCNESYTAYFIAERGRWYADPETYMWFDCELRWCRTSRAHPQECEYCSTTCSKGPRRVRDHHGVRRCRKRRREQELEATQGGIPMATAEVAEEPTPVSRRKRVRDNGDDMGTEDVISPDAPHSEPEPKRLRWREPVVLGREIEASVSASGTIAVGDSTV